MECPLFRGLCAQIVHSPPKLTYKRHILGMSTSPRNDSFCHTSCTLVTSTPSRILLPWAVFWACKTRRRNSEISHGCTLLDANSRQLFQTWSKLVQDKFPEGHIVLVPEKKHGVWQNPWGEKLLGLSQTVWPQSKPCSCYFEILMRIQRNLGLAAVNVFDTKIEMPPPHESVSRSVKRNTLKWC